MSHQQDTKQKNPNVPTLRFGSFREGWREARLEETLAKEKHAFVGGPFGSNLQSKDYTECGVMIIQLNNIGIGTFNLENRKFTSVEKANELRSCNAFPGDIIIAKMMPAGRACILPNTYGRYVMGSDAIRVKIDSNAYNPFFICAQINTERCHKWINERTGGSTRQRIGLPALRMLPLWIPCLLEQQKIAKFLALIDTYIEVQNKIIGELSSLRKRLIDSFLKLKNSSFMVESLANLLTEAKEKNGSGFPIYSVSVDAGLVNQIAYLGRSFAAKETGHYNVARFGDIIYTKSPTGAFPYGIVKQSWIKHPVAISPLYGVYRPISFEVGYYIHMYFLNSINANNYLRPLVDKGAKNTMNITNKRFLEGRIPIPAKSVVITISCLLNRINAKIEASVNALRLYQKEKSYFLRMLFI